MTTKGDNVTSKPILISQYRFHLSLILPPFYIDFSLFYYLLLSGEAIKIPQFLKEIPEPRTEHCFVWQKLLRHAEIHIDNKIRNDTNITECDLSQVSLENAEELLANKNSNLSEFQLLRIIYKWWHSTNDEEGLKRLLTFINFSRLSFMQKRLCYLDFYPYLDKETVFNALSRSVILSRKDIKMLEGSYTEHWHLRYRKWQDDDFDWLTFKSLMQENSRKLVVFDFDLGERWIICVCLEGSLEESETTSVSHVQCRAFVSVHGEENDVKLTPPLTNDFLLDFDKQRLQIYSGSKGNTFICLMNLEDDMTGMSVALNKFERNLPDRHGGMRIRRQKFLKAEIFSQSIDCLPEQSSYTIFSAVGKPVNHSQSPVNKDNTNEDAGCYQNGYNFTESEFPPLGQQEKELIEEGWQLLEQIEKKSKIGPVSSEELLKIRSMITGPNLTVSRVF